ncbi:SsrA-binding protein [Candidatus Bealeia paramacronuclearis]|uniref:SsrA-binding protein n=1 Tax=Candidatus Bealeia paramacronuclearis TaxID=1921001 RepID=A0ABZ2C4W4_9PROT|nr:SsrA-binding protein [Candidatus Bealeia paramacronuclearis]
MTKVHEKKMIAQNKRARFDYHIESTIEAGVMLQGSEVKSLRQGKGSISESYASSEGTNDLYLINSFIPEYIEANRFNHSPTRPRKLLLKRRELNKLLGAVRKKGMTIVPLNLYFNSRGMVKLEIALVSGKNKADKRATEKERDWKRDQSRILKGDMD